MKPFNSLNVSEPTTGLLLKWLVETYPGLVTLNTPLGNVPLVSEPTENPVQKLVEEFQKQNFPNGGGGFFLEGLKQVPDYKQAEELIQAYENKTLTVPAPRTEATGRIKRYKKMSRSDRQLVCQMTKAGKTPRTIAITIGTKELNVTRYLDGYTYPDCPIRKEVLG